MILDTERWKVSLAGKPLMVTRSEFKVLRRLAMADGKLVTRGALVRDVFKGSISGRSVDQHIYKLRAKLPEGTIRTIWGEGYSIEGVRVK